MKYYVKLPRAPVDQPWTVEDLTAAYGYPNGTAPGGGVIAIGELGGGWVLQDLATNFADNPAALPTVTDVAADPGAGNAPGGAADVEVMLDIVCAAKAYYRCTGKPADIRVYWANNDATGIQHATAVAATDGCDVMSWSWGQDEAGWGPAGLDSMEAAAHAAVSVGMVVFAASGDNDSADGGPGAANVDAPASCPSVIGCGGTTKPHHTVAAAQETVWNNNPGNADGEGTGGGFSQHFAMPRWQNGAPHGSGRMVPDLAANADPNTGYRIFVGGQWGVVGGTSAVAPLITGLFASFGRKLGFITPTLWMFHLMFWDVTQGDNGAYRARPGADPCTGLGVPRGGRVAARFIKP